MPDLSVVIAAVDGRADVLDAVPAVRGQDRSDALEVILAANAGHPGIAAARRVPGVTVIESGTPKLVPELWGLGIAASRGAVIGITMAGCVPAPHWVEALRRAHRTDAAAVGGPIEQGWPASVGDWALYFARYAAYMGPFEERAVSDVPGDNGSYKRDAIAQDLEEIERRGFWETEINLRLRRRGARLVMRPDLAVWHTHSYGVAGFSRQRWQHGKLHGRSRSEGASFPSRAVRAVGAPLAWALMLVRVTTHVARRRRHQVRFAMAVPLIAWFYLCWIGGEVAGLLGPAE